jgi:hypothetical protein
MPLETNCGISRLAIPFSTWSANDRSCQRLAEAVGIASGRSGIV